MMRTRFGYVATVTALGCLLWYAGCKSDSSSVTTPAAATQLAIVTQPSSSASAGATFAQQPSLQLRDATGKAVSQAAVVVTVAIATGGGTLGGTTTASTNASGVATFANLSITGTIGDRTLSFSAPSLTGATSGPITIAAGAATALTIITQPSSSAAAGGVLVQQPAVQLQDASGNAVGQSGVVVTAAIATGGGTLGGTLTATTNASGVATFTNLAISGAVGGRTLSFSAPSVTGVASGTITIVAGAATQLTITTQPSGSVAAGAVFAQQPVLQLRDASGNAVSQAGVVVTAAIATGGGTLGGTLTATTSATGVATFTNLSIVGAVGDRTLSFSAPSLTGATSATVTITVAITLPSLAGTWSGTWVDTRYSVQGTITNVVITQTATTISGTGTIDLTSLGLGMQSGTATGTISGNTITFTFTAAVIGSGSGTLNGTAGSGTGSVTAMNLGNFTFTGTASSTQITGSFNFTSPTGGLGTITVNKLP
jgi:hypothetical protein